MYEKIRAYYFLALAEAAHGSDTCFVRLWNTSPIMCQEVDSTGVPIDVPTRCGSIDLYLQPSHCTAELTLAHWQEVLGFELMTFDQLTEFGHVWIQLHSGNHWLSGPKSGTFERM